MNPHKLRTIGVLFIALLTIKCSAQPPGTPTAPTPAPPAGSSCACPLTSSLIDNTAPDGSYAQVSPGSCIAPPPCPKTVKVDSRQPPSWNLTEDQLAKLEQKGKIYSVLDITPEGRTWNPAIAVRFQLRQLAPQDDFRLTIYQWRDAEQDWSPTGTARAEKKDDVQALGEIAHTSLYGLVDQQAGPQQPTSVPPPVPIPAPVVDFSAKQSSGCQVTAEFQNLSTNADRFLWDFGDGTQSTETNPTHTYLSQKEEKFAFTVRLDAEGPGGKDTKTKADFIASECVPPPAPKADFIAKPGDGAQYKDPSSPATGIIGSSCTTFTVNFVSLSSDADSFLWDFGDGTTSTENNPIHTYSRSGQGTVKYTVRLDVAGPGGKDTASKADYIESQCIG